MLVMCFFELFLGIFKLTPSSFVSKHTTLPLLCYILCVITLLWSFTAITGLLVNENVWLFLDAVTYICLALYSGLTPEKKKKKKIPYCQILAEDCVEVRWNPQFPSLPCASNGMDFFFQGGRSGPSLWKSPSSSFVTKLCSSHPCSRFCWKDITLSHACLGENPAYMCGLVRRLITQGGSRPLQAFTTSYWTNAACSGGGKEHRGTDIPKITQVGTFHIHYW